MSDSEVVDAVVVHPPGTEVATYQAPVIEEYRARFVMAPEEAAELDHQLRECMRAVLVDGTDYGPIPGGDPNKKNLLKPGAQKLLQWFGFGFSNDRTETERDADGIRVGVTYRCTVFKEMTDGRKVEVATCEGYAGYDEDRYYTSAEDARAKAEAKERGYARKDDRAPKPEKWQNATEYKAPWNTVLKMAQKRALVGAAIDATAASGLFTQDMEDMRAEADGGKFTEAATAAVMALPEDVRMALDRWYQARKWPLPARWSPEQWCAALQEAGRLDARRQQPQQPAPPAASPQASAEDWVGDAIGKAANAADGKAVRALWAESVQKAAAGVITKIDAARVQEVLRGRIEDLGREAARAALGDPDDPWAVKVDSLASAEDAAAALVELGALASGGIMGEDRAARVRTAILARFPGAAAVQAAAA